MYEEVRIIREFNRFYTRFIGLLDDTLLHSPVTLIEGRLLFEICQRTNCNATVLRESLGLDRGYVSRILSRLVRIGLVHRGTDPRDRRVRHLMLTPDGEQLMGVIHQRADEQIGGILGSIKPADRKRLVKAMADIRNILEKSC